MDKIPSDSPRYTLSRRQFTKQAAFIGLGAAVAPEVLSRSKSLSISETHLYAAEQAAKIGTGSQLKIMLPEGCEENVSPVAEAFTRLSGVDVEIQTVPVDDINTHMFLSVSADEYRYDIALPATFGLPDLVEAGAIANLNEFRVKHEPQAFMTSVLYSVGDFYRGNFYGYQSDGDAYLMFYNQSLVNELEQKRYEDNFSSRLETPVTWQELDRQMAFFHKPDKGVFGGALFRTSDYMAWEWWVRFHAKGLLPLDDDLTPNISSEGGIEALYELISASKYLYPEASVNGLFANWKAYAKGNIYANIGWGGTQKYLNKPGSKMRGKMTFSSTPGGVVGGRYLKVPYFNWGWNYAVAENSVQKELAYLFTLFASSPAPSTLAVSNPNGFFDPYRQEHYRDETIVASYSEPFLLAHRESMAGCIPDFYMRGQSRYFGELRKYISMANNGEISPRQALETVAKSWQRLHRKFGQDKQREQWLLLKKQYPSGFLSILS